MEIILTSRQAERGSHATAGPAAIKVWGPALSGEVITVPFPFFFSFLAAFFVLLCSVFSFFPPLIFFHLLILFPFLL